MARYTDRKSITGQHYGRLAKALSNLFPKMELLERFVEESLGRDTHSSICWQTVSGAAYDLIQHCSSRGHVGTLVEAMQKIQPNNSDFNELVTYLVDAGYLLDSEAVPTAPVRKYAAQDWQKVYGWDRFTLDGASRRQVLDALGVTFTTNAELERFLVGSFNNDFARQVANGMGATLPIRANLDYVLKQFERVNWVTSVVAAALAADQTNYLLALLLATMQQANSPKPAPSPPAAPMTAARTASPAVANVVVNPRPAPVLEPEPKPLAVGKLLKPLSKEQQSQLVQLLLVAFDRHGLDEIAYFNLGERLDNITAPGPLAQMAGTLVQWAVEQEGSVVLLLNAMVTKRKLRTDIPAFVRQLEKDGFVTLA